jgi:hypothetical protein
MTKVDQNTFVLVGGRPLSAMNGKTALESTWRSDRERFSSNSNHLSSNLVADNTHTQPPKPKENPKKTHQGDGGRRERVDTLLHNIGDAH